MIDPFDCTDFERTDAELEEFLLFCVAVAGKTALQIADALKRFLNKVEGSTPFDRIRKMIQTDTLLANIIGSKIGKHKLLTKAFGQIVEAGLDLRTCLPADLEQIHGISFKTSRYFIVHSRSTTNLAAIDTHMLKYLGSLGYKVPKTTPSNAKQYERLERIVITLARQNQMTLADFDLSVWKTYARPKEVKCAST